MWETLEAHKVYAVGYGHKYLGNPEGLLEVQYTYDSGKPNSFHKSLDELPFGSAINWIRRPVFSISDAQATEGEYATAVISRKGGLEYETQVIAKVSGGNAVNGGGSWAPPPRITTNGTDYIAKGIGTGEGFFIFKPGEEKKEVKILILEDELVEGPEYFYITLDAWSDAALEFEDAKAVITIIDNDGDNTTASVTEKTETETENPPKSNKEKTAKEKANTLINDIINAGIGDSNIINGDVNITIDNSVNNNKTINQINIFNESIVNRSIMFGNKEIEKIFVDISKFASQKSDKIGGTELADFLQMGDGDDEFTGGLGGDSIYGNKGRDILYGNQGDDEIKGNMGDDIIYGGKDADSIYGNLDNDKLYGNIGNDYLYGGQGDDVIYAGQGDDYVYGNKGNDTLYGNLGADTFVCTKGFDVIKDFWYQDGDKISVASVANTVISEKDGSTLITSGEGQLLLEGFPRFLFDESQYLI